MSNNNSEDIAASSFANRKALFQNLQKPNPNTTTPSTTTTASTTNNKSTSVTSGSSGQSSSTTNSTPGKLPAFNPINKSTPPTTTPSNVTNNNNSSSSPANSNTSSSSSSSGGGSSQFREALKGLSGAGGNPLFAGGFVNKSVGASSNLPTYKPSTPRGGNNSANNNSTPTPSVKPNVPETVEKKEPPKLPPRRGSGIGSSTTTSNTPPVVSSSPPKQTTTSVQPPALPPRKLSQKKDDPPQIPIVVQQPIVEAVVEEQPQQQHVEEEIHHFEEEHIEEEEEEEEVIQVRESIGHESDDDDDESDSEESSTPSTPSGASSSSNTLSSTNTNNNSTPQTLNIPQQTVPPLPKKTPSQETPIVDSYSITLQNATQSLQNKNTDQDDDPTSNLPKGWAAYFDSGRQAHYYHNEFTGKTTWKKPPPDVIVSTSSSSTTTVEEEQLEDGWTAYFDNGRQAYYYHNEKTNTTTWKKPVKIVVKKQTPPPSLPTVTVQKEEPSSQVVAQKQQQPPVVPTRKLSQKKEEPPQIPIVNVVSEQTTTAPPSLPPVKPARPAGKTIITENVEATILQPPSLPPAKPIRKEGTSPTTITNTVPTTQETSLPPPLPGKPSAMNKSTPPQIPTGKPARIQLDAATLQDHRQSTVIRDDVMLQPQLMPSLPDETGFSRKSISRDRYVPSEYQQDFRVRRLEDRGMCDDLTLLLSQSSTKSKKSEQMVVPQTTEITEIDLTNILANRYYQNEIYTCVGPAILSINPYKGVKSLYSNETKALFHSHIPYELAPHIYSLAEDAYRTLLEHATANKPTSTHVTRSKPPALTSSSGSAHSKKMPPPPPPGKPINKDSDLDNDTFIINDFSISDGVGVGQAIIIQGESGSGKTLASRIIMEYLAAVSISGLETQRIKDSILQSNPLLESFGNAKTLRNNNSSRFGKFTNLYFNFKGQLMGGELTTILLEKARVVKRRLGERNFHIFYQLLSDDYIRKQLNLGFPEEYNYLNNNVINVNEIDDKTEFESTKRAMDLLDMSLPEQMAVFKIVAAILQLGNITFAAIVDTDERKRRNIAPGVDACDVSNEASLKLVANTLQIDAELLRKSMIVRVIKTVGSPMPIEQTQSVEQAEFNRDTLAKNIYERLFLWLVKRVNRALRVPDYEDFVAKKNADTYYNIGILDIYGFEIYDKNIGTGKIVDQDEASNDKGKLKNGFEQLCINFVNEKIQSGVQRSIKKEQEDIQKEIYGDDFKPTLASSQDRNKRFDSDAAIQMIAGKPISVFSLLDEESMFPNGNDVNYVQKMKTNVKHPYFKIPRIAEPTEFELEHFAALVKYNTSDGWVDKNRDTLLAEMLNTMQNTKDHLLMALFPKNEQANDVLSKKPANAGTKLQQTTAEKFLRDVGRLMNQLSSCSLKHHHIRCIIPNYEGRADDFQKDVVNHQVRYLGILDTVLSRKADDLGSNVTGYSIKIPYDTFLERYKLLCPETFPYWETFITNKYGPVEEFTIEHKKEAVHQILSQEHLGMTNPQDFFLGRGNVLLASPVQLFQLDAMVREQKHEMARKIQNSFRRYRKKRAEKMDEMMKKAIKTTEPTKQKEAPEEIRIRHDGFRTSNFGETKKRVLITGSDRRNIFLLDTTSSSSEFEQLRKIAIRDIKKVYISPYSDNYMIFKLDMDEGDELVELNNKWEFLEEFNKLIESTASNFKGEHVPRIEVTKDISILNHQKDKSTSTQNLLVRFIPSAYNTKKTVTTECFSDEFDNRLFVVNTFTQADIYNQRKLRRKASLYARQDQNRDYLRMQNSELMQLLKKDYDDTKVLFSGVVSKYNKRFKKQDRIFMVTDKAIYNIDPSGGYLINRRVPIGQVGSVTVSPYTDNFFVVDHPDQDILSESAKKTEILEAILESFQNSTNQLLPVKVTTNYNINLAKKNTKRVGISWIIEPENQTQFSVSTLLPTSAGGAEVHVVSEVDNDSDKSMNDLAVRQSFQRRSVRGKMVKNGEMDEVDLNDVFGGLKVRRKDSLLVWFQGDYLNFKENPKFVEMVKKHDPEWNGQVLFSNLMTKVNKRFRTQPRKVVVTPNFIYTLDEEKMQFNRVTPIKDLSGISLSTMRDAFFVVHCPTDHDLFASCKKKTELVSVICDAFKDRTGMELPVHVEDKFVYKPSTDVKGVKTIEFRHDPTTKVPILTPTKLGCLIQVNNSDPEKLKQNLPTAKQQKPVATPQLKLYEGSDERGIQDKMDSIYTGRKGRNRRSLMREYLGDYLRLEGTQRMKKIFDRNGDSELIFSGQVLKYNKNFKKQHRLLVVTDKHVYNIDEQEFKIKRKIPLEEITGVSVSPFDDNVFVMHCPTSGDYLLEDEKKTEIISALQNARMRHLKQPLKINVDDQFNFAPNTSSTMPVTFISDDHCKDTWAENRANALVVHVKRQEPGVVLEAAYLYLNEESKPIEVKSTPILIKLKKRWTYKLQIRFYVNEYLAGCEFHEKIDTVAHRLEFVSKVVELEPKEERYVITLPERKVIYSLLSKTRVKCKLVDPTGKVLMAVRFVYDIQ